MYYVGTTKAASLLMISTRRLRQLLKEGRVIGAYKSGNFWFIPLYEGLPNIKQGTRGPVSSWKKRKRLSLTRIHINRHNINRNRNKSKEERQPVISVKRGTENIYGFEVEIASPCRVVYRPDKPLACGACVWIETLCSEIHFVGSSFTSLKKT